ncbi:hypothetical protein Bpfe_011300 [Biomphalaria pfeifferi]|uniref:Uncharacterized protein n=1 Tax=Biomphalaria pfeifferi TaxID=112525 RepID=A0AAD8FDJ1_BIOPF|nr:hypothetical protein Bpfe_011300 [Biomphalaria pfeifferi]
MKRRGIDVKYRQGVREQIKNETLAEGKSYSDWSSHYVVVYGISNLTQNGLWLSIGSELGDDTVSLGNVCRCQNTDAIRF